MASLSGATIASTFKSLLKLTGNTDDLAAASGANAVQVVTGDGDATLLYLNTNKIGINTNEVGRMLEVKDTAAQLRLTQASKYAEFFTTSDGDLQIVLNTAARNIKFDDNDKLMFGTSSTDETVYGDGNDLILTSGRDIYLTAASGRSVIMGVDEKLQFGDATEYIMGDADDLELYSSRDITLQATTNVNIPSGVGLTFADDGEKISGNGTNLTLISGGDIELSPTNQVVIPVNKQLDFGDGNQHIKTDNTDLIITSDVAVNLVTPKVDIGKDDSTDITINLLGTNDMAIAYDTSATLLNFDSNTLVVDGANNRIGIGTVAPSYPLHIVSAANNLLRVESTEATNNVAGPIIDLYRHDDRDDNGLAGMITFTSLNDNDEDIVYGTITSEVVDESDSSERGRIVFQVMDGDSSSAAELKTGLVICGTGSTKNGANVGIGLDVDTTPDASLHITGDSSVQRQLFLWDNESSGVDSGHVIQMNRFNQSNADGAFFIQFADADGTIGGITVNGASNTAFATSSDYRLKTDLKTITNATAEINQLKLYDFAWTRNPSKREYGVLAHEAEAIYSPAILGTKDKVNADGSIEPQLADYSKFVPLLLKAVQELSAKVTALENA